MLLFAPLRAWAQVALRTFELADFNVAVFLAKLEGGSLCPVRSDLESEATREGPTSNVEMDDVWEQRGEASMLNKVGMARGKCMFSAAAEMNSAGLPSRFGSVHLLHAVCACAFRVNFAQTAGGRTLYRDTIADK